ncbi:cytosine-specific methyltransferase [Synergistales bacterium]|nr:cytosine-specific methyltransferase [Synergistales bacterium]
MFAGIGGICLAFKRAGAEIVWANEIDRYACETYKHNFGADYLCEGDIRTQDLSTIPDFDVLTAGFPCQPFSIMGKQQGFTDPRGTMFFEILRVIDEKRPAIVLLENVKNLQSHDNGHTFKTIIRSLAERKYGSKSAVLGAHTHGNIPQYRDRIFIAAFRNYEQWKRFEFPPTIPLTVAINDIIKRDERQTEYCYYPPTNKHYEQLNHRMTDGTAIYRIDDSGIAMRAWRISPTLKANMGTYHDRVPLVRDRYGIRKLTVRDCLNLQGFPSDYAMPDIPVNEQYKQLGNTVCVPVVERIAKQIHLTIPHKERNKNEPT